MEKICGTARKLDVFFRILFYLIIVFAVLVAGVSVWMAVSLPGASGMDHMMLSVNGISFELADQYMSGVDFRSAWVMAAVMLIIGAGISCAAVSIIRNILIPMKDGRPFADSVSRDFKKLGWLAVIGGVIYNIYDAIGKRLIFGQIDFPQSAVIEVKITHQLDVSFILIAALLFLFAYVFRYGRELQQLSDETL